MPEKQPILSESEMHKVMEAAILGSGGLATEDQIIGAVQWAKLARVQAGLLDGILEGRFIIDMRPAEPVFALAHQPAGADGSR